MRCAMPMGDGCDIVVKDAAAADGYRKCGRRPAPVRKLEIDQEMRMCDECVAAQAKRIDALRQRVARLR